jgi:hypothetical protein
MDRHFHKHILGPSFGGQRKLRVAPGLLEAEAMLAPGMVEARAIAEILEVVQMQEGVFDGTWMNPSCRALWYVPRSLCKLHRWEEFVEYICNLDYIIEGTLEFGVLEVEHQYEVALKYISAQRSNTTAFLTLKQKTIDAYCESTIAAYLEFVKDNRKSLAAVMPLASHWHHPVTCARMHGHISANFRACSIVLRLSFPFPKQTPLFACTEHLSELRSMEYSDVCLQTSRMFSGLLNRSWTG